MLSYPTKASIKLKMESKMTAAEDYLYFTRPQPTRQMKKMNKKLHQLLMVDSYNSFKHTDLFKNIQYNILKIYEDNITNLLKIQIQHENINNELMNLFTTDIIKYVENIEETNLCSKFIRDTLMFKYYEDGDYSIMEPDTSTYWNIILHENYDENKIYQKPVLDENGCKLIVFCLLKYDEYFYEKCFIDILKKIVKKKEEAMNKK